jgi:hypothetical protein
VAADRFVASDIRILDNPADEATSISLASTNDSKVKIEIIDMLGRQIGTVFDGLLHTGTNTFPIRSNDLTNGTYFVRIESLGSIITEKLRVLH